MPTTPETNTPTPYSTAMLVRACIKALILFALFNLLYAQIQPLQHGLLPSLYNTVFPARERLIKSDEFDPYRLVEDHVIMQARADTFNIVMLGSSEIWGSRTSPAFSIPAYLDTVGLVAPDGRPVRVYNLGYPLPSLPKDLTLLDVASQHNIPIDLAVFSVFDATLGRKYSFYQNHPILLANPTLTQAVFEKYGISQLYSPPKNTQSLSLWPIFDDRQKMATWLTMQMRGIVWSAMGGNDDVDTSIEPFRRPIPSLTDPMGPVTLERLQPENTVLFALEKFREEHKVPILILGAPVPVESNAFSPWLQVQADAAHLPLLDCWNVFAINKFEDYFHITSETHVLYAYILAKYLGSPAWAGEAKNLPLKLPPDFVVPEETCALYPSQGTDQ